MSDIQDRAIQISHYPAAANTAAQNPNTLDTTVKGLLELLCAPCERVRTKGAASAWSPIVYLKEAESRQGQFALRACALVYDIDNPEYDYDAFSDRMGDSIFLVHESYTDGRGRIVIPLSEDLLPRNYTATYHRVGQALVRDYDLKCGDLGRLFFLPSCSPLASRGAPTVRGTRLFEVSSVATSAALRVAPDKRALDLEALRAEIKGLKDKSSSKELLQLVDGTLDVAPGERNGPLHRMLSTLATLRNSPSEEQCQELVERVLRKRNGAEHNMGLWLKEAASSYSRGLNWIASEQETAARALKILTRAELVAAGREWEESLIKSRDKQGNEVTENNFTNLTTVIAHDEKFKGHIRWNVLRKKIEVTGGPFEGLTLTNLVNDVTRNLQLSDYKFKPALTTASVGEALQAVARKNEYDPVREYLDSLPLWDGVPRLGNLLLRYANARGNEDWIRLVTTKFFIAAVARAMEPGCQVDNILLLHGGQGGGKTSFVRTMGGDFAVEMHLDVRDKDAILVASGAWFVELSELASLRTSSIESTRSFISRKVDEIRLPYERAPEQLHRRCVFVGTTNNDEPLKDPEGNRRFWPITVGLIDIPGLEEVRSLVWAEALYLYRSKEQWWLTQEEARTAAHEASLYESSDDSIAEELVEKLNTMSPDSRPTEITLRYIVTTIFGRMPGDNVSELERRILLALRRLKWKKVRRQIEGHRTTFYIVPARHQIPIETHEVAKSKERKQ